LGCLQLVEQRLHDLVVVLCLILGAVAANLRLLDFVATATTAAPALIWAVREQFRQSDAADAVETLKSEAEKILDQTKTGLCDEAECERRSREFQDAIFGRRVANPLILPLIYRLMRPELEQQMEAGAEAMLKEYISPNV
jgi:hypothetical protein